MPKGGRLSGYEQGYILAKRSEGKSLRAIGDTIHTFLKDLDGYGTRKRSGRPKKLTERGVRQVKNATKQRGMSTARIKNAYNPTVSKRIVQRIF
uniref:Tc3 transposase DNA binding domain-containing protein n=1 Tax=Globisporangium ultimum (strain ATCC 200006 / CBS 805.95 / DAOM BR144) TaxID=431595 RepID=K3W9Q2_GLOUD